jgi:hypothetical protein
MPTPQGQNAHWDDVERRICNLAAGDTAVPAATLANALNFVAFARARLQPPASVSRGYWPTVCLSWPDAEPLPDVEIFDSHYELYRVGEGRTEIEHIEHGPGEPLPDALAMFLDQAAGHARSER